MKILFVVHDLEYHSPLGIMQISAIAKQKGHKVFLGILTREDVLEKIDQLQPEIVAYGGSTGEHKHYEIFNKKLKEKHPDIFTVMGGPHATFFPEVLEQANLNAIIIGEGELAFADLLDNLQNNLPLDNIENLQISLEKKPKIRPLIQDLDSLPFPDRDLFFQNTENGSFPIKHFMASRGCPYDCTYCFNKSFRGMYPGQKYTRRHSVNYLINEILEVKSKYPIEYIKFYDDIFTFQVDDWLKEFVQKYKEKVNLPFYCLTRADLLTEEMTELLKQAGCRTIQMASESTNDRIRNELLHRNMSKEQMKRAFKICKNAGITVVTNYILGLPTSTIQDDLDSVYFNIEAEVPVPEFPIFQPYPRTELGEYCLKNNLFEGDFEKIHASYNNRSPLNCFTEKEKDIQANINRLGHMAVTAGITKFSKEDLFEKYPSIKNLFEKYPFLKKMKNFSIVDLIMRELIYLSPSEFFAKAYSKHKWELYSSLVYPLKHSKKREEKIKEKSFRLETLRRVNENQK